MTETKTYPQVFSPDEVPKLPENGSSAIKSEVTVVAQVAHQVVEKAFASLTSDDQTEIKNQLRAIDSLRQLVRQTYQTWEQRLTEVRRINTEIRELNDNIQLANQVHADVQRTVRVANPIVTNLLRRIGVPISTPAEHAGLTVATSLDASFKKGDVKELEAQRDALGDIPLPEHMHTMEWILTKLDEAVEVMQQYVKSDTPDS